MSKKILLIKRGAVGDILMTTPLLRQLRLNLPTTQIDYCLARSFATVLLNNPYLDNIITMEDNVFESKQIIKLIKFILSIRNKYDYIFILGKSWQFNLLSILFKGITIGYARESISKLFLNKYIVYNDILRYHGLYYLDLLKASNLSSPNYHDLSLDLYVGENDKLKVHNTLEEKLLNNQKFILVVNSGGNNQYESTGIRMLPINKFTELINKLLAHHNVILLGNNTDKEYYAQIINNNASLQHNNQHNKNKIYNLANEFNLQQSTYLISLAYHFYTTDCGAMHLGVAANMQNKMTCFFGPTSPHHVLPSSTKCKIIWHDADIFDEKYSIYGTSNDKQYFKKLDIAVIV